jgi:hypothetical protein
MVLSRRARNERAEFKSKFVHLRDSKNEEVSDLRLSLGQRDAVSGFEDGAAWSSHRRRTLVGRVDAENVARRHCQERAYVARQI